MVFREAGVDVVSRLDVQTIAQLAVHGSIEVLLHVAICDPRTGGQPASPVGDLLLEALRGKDGIDDAEVLGLLGQIRSEK